jgi:hypothetical protein
VAQLVQGSRGDTPTRANFGKRSHRRLLGEISNPRKRGQAFIECYAGILLRVNTKAAPRDVSLGLRGTVSGAAIASFS